MVKFKNGIFDIAPVPQKKSGNKFSYWFNLFVFFFFILIFILIILADMPDFTPKYILAAIPLFFSSTSLLTVYGIKQEMKRIRETAKIIHGALPEKINFIEGVFSDESVWFSVAFKPTSINYGINLDGGRAIKSKSALEQYIFNELAADNLKGFKILITEDSLILSKYYFFPTQLVPQNVTPIYSILINAKREILT